MGIPSGNLLHSYWKCPFIGDLPIENGDVPSFFCMFTRSGGIIQHHQKCWWKLIQAVPFDLLKPSTADFFGVRYGGMGPRRVRSERMTFLQIKDDDAKTDDFPIRIYI